MVINFIIVLNIINYDLIFLIEKLNIVRKNVYKYIFNIILYIYRYVQTISNLSCIV